MIDPVVDRLLLVVGTAGAGAPAILAQVPGVPEDFKDWPPFVVGGAIAILSLFMMYKQGEGYRRTIDKQSEAMVKLARLRCPYMDQKEEEKRD